MVGRGTVTDSRFAGARWRKSNLSMTGECVEVAYAGGLIGVRDSKQGEAGPVLAFTSGEWAAFLGGARQGEFDEEGYSGVYIAAGQAYARR
ncbi:DUF397 domain-containing protein [Solwaraspora sp. WMMD406]|uniref:DUF397 domain-containing protein n=1 Tax=Solwaraspora sp. WMMD406 TaxID=3016095 RepID=UPI00241791F5|nr:DUF397 domain-containing protein [Solwaraspora sp. WMMD406]MDG4767700.1 DUF397 domain-containing protein [Solwaraspora sp. WMMD406]